MAEAQDTFVAGGSTETEFMTLHHPEARDDTYDAYMPIDVRVRAELRGLGSRHPATSGNTSWATWWTRPILATLYNPDSEDDLFASTETRDAALRVWALIEPYVRALTRLNESRARHRPPDGNSTEPGPCWVRRNLRANMHSCLPAAAPRAYHSVEHATMHVGAEMSGARQPGELRATAGCTDGTYAARKACWGAVNWLGRGYMCALANLARPG